METLVKSLINWHTNLLIKKKNIYIYFSLQVPYDITISEDTEVGTTIFQGIRVKDADLVGDPIEVFCVPPEKPPNNCLKFSIVPTESTEQNFKGVVVLREPLDYSKKQFYQLVFVATVRKKFFSFSLFFFFPPINGEKEFRDRCYIKSIYVG